MGLIIRALLIAFLIQAALYLITNETEIIEDRITDKKYHNVLDTLGIQCQDVVIAQMCLETGIFSSKIFRENHNPFGMKFNNRGYADYELHGHAHYPSIIDALYDYRDWQNQMAGNRIFKSNEEYLDFLDHLPPNRSRRYAEDMLYTDKLRNIIHKLHSND